MTLPQRARLAVVSSNRWPTRTSSTPGAGLGLGLVQWIAAQHGGSVLARSRPGEGATFAVTLPLAGSAAPAT